MAGPTDNSDPKSSSAFKAAAERFERIAQVVKDQQLSETRTGPRIARPDNFVASPQEVWARQFMTQSIGPAAPRATFAPVPSYVPLATTPAAGPEIGTGFSRIEAKTARAAPRPQQDQTIGMALGKPGKKRSWIGRLLLGRY
jgi:hypothetical protein